MQDPAASVIPGLLSSLTEHARSAEIIPGLKMTKRFAEPMPVQPSRKSHPVENATTVQHTQDHKEKDMNVKQTYAPPERNCCLMVLANYVSLLPLSLQIKKDASQLNVDQDNT